MLSCAYEQLRKIINSQSAQRTFPNRTINSLYFDTASLNDYHDSEEGTVPRKKIRVRWYGTSRFEGVATGTLETKKTLSNHREKTSVSIKGITQEEILSLVNNLRGEKLIPVVVVTYQRQYFQNTKHHRFTLDSKIVYSNISRTFKYLNRTFDYTNILELKINTNVDSSIAMNGYADLQTRFSKYCEAVKRFRN